jgi:hypothetical protein
MSLAQSNHIDWHDDVQSFEELNIRLSRMCADIDDNFISFASQALGMASALTVHGVLVGQATSPIAKTIAPGTAGHVLTSAGSSADPAFAAIAVTEANLTLSDVTTDDVSITKHGFAPKAPNDGTKFLDGTGAYDTVKDSDLSTSDITTGDVTSAKHGFAPKSVADATKFLNSAAPPAYAQVKDSDLATTDVTTNNVTSAKHGFAPKSGADATTFMNGAATPAYAQVKDSDLALTDITTNNVSNAKHGFAPKNPNDATKYLDGTGAYSVPAGGDFVKFSETILGADTATVSFSSIPATYRNLMLTVQVRNDNAAAGATDGYMQFNGDTAANYSRSFGAWTGAVTNSGQTIAAAKCPAFFAINSGAAAGLATALTIIIYDYARTQWVKTATSLMAIPLALSAGNLQGNTISFVWNSTAAINAILLGMTDTSKFKTGSVFSCYLIR